VTLTCHARDIHDNEGAALTREVVVHTFEAVRPSMVEIEVLAAPEVEVARMRLVEGDPRYMFGGRPQRLENKTFSDHGLTYDWRSQVEDRSVTDFYLDETEVTVQQYRAFLEEPEGYRNGANWSGAAPNEARRQELIRELQRVEARLPITSIDWDEAAAYARWVGKRLPSLVEWEYAVRGGRAYRPYSSAVEGEAPDLTTLNVDTDFSGDDSAWTVDAGSDVTPAGIGSGIRNLCSNVSEWTATKQTAGSFFAAGADFAHLGAFDFSIAAVLPGDTRSERIGFRCALDGADVDAAIEGMLESRIVVKSKESGTGSMTHEER
jgi:hypothetical protein